MEFEELDDATIAEVLEAPTKNEPLFVDEDEPDAELQLCEYCGACESPETCVWGIQCPRCYAPPMQQCTAENGGLTGLHEERHELAQSPYWRKYRAS